MKAAHHTDDPVMDIYARLNDAKMMRNAGNYKELDNSISNLLRMAQRWDDAEMDCLMLMAATFSSIGFEGRGDFNMDSNGRLSRRQPQRVTPFAWPGVQIIHPRLVDKGPNGVFSTNVLWDIAIEQGRLFGIRLDGKWMHVGTPEAKLEADHYLSERHKLP